MAFLYWSVFLYESVYVYWMQCWMQCWKGSESLTE